MKVKAIGEKIQKLTVPRARSDRSSLFMESDRELTLFRCIGLSEYSEEHVVLCTAEHTLSICGSMLKLKSFSTSEITVYGRIASLEFSKNEKR